MIITIEGKRGEGKTSLAKQITNGKRTIWMAEHNMDTYWGTGLIDETIEYVVIDDIVNMDKFTHLKDAHTLIIERPMKPSYEIPMPNFILITQSN